MSELVAKLPQLPVEKYGIEGLKALFSLGIEFGEGCVKSLADGKVGYTDLFNFSDIPMEVMAHFQDLKMIYEEYKDLSDAEKAELRVFVQKKLESTSEKVRDWFKLGFDIIISVLGIGKLAGHDPR